MTITDNVLYSPAYKGVGRPPKSIRYIEDNNGCFICISQVKDRCGYPKINADGKNWTVHRYIFSIFNSDVDIEGLEIRHICDNPACINPEHLLPGTHLANMQDMRRRNRHHVPDQKGELHSQARLTSDDVITIRELWAAGDIEQKDIGSIYNISQSHVSTIVNRRVWRHV